MWKNKLILSNGFLSGVLKQSFHKKGSRTIGHRTIGHRTIGHMTIGHSAYWSYIGLLVIGPTGHRSYWS